MLAIVINVTINSKAVVKLVDCYFFVAISQYFKCSTFYCLVRLNFGDY